MKCKYCEIGKLATKYHLLCCNTVPEEYFFTNKKQSTKEYKEKIRVHPEKQWSLYKEISCCNCGKNEVELILSHKIGL